MTDDLIIELVEPHLSACDLSPGDPFHRVIEVHNPSIIISDEPQHILITTAGKIGPQGPIGPTGPQGPPGTSGEVEFAAALKITRIASEIIHQGEQVKADSPTHVSIAHPNLSFKDATVLGTAAHSANAGENLAIILLGAISSTDFSAFAVNETLFLDDDGGITNTRRSSGHHTIIGRSLGGTEIFVQPMPPLVIAS